MIRLYRLTHNPPEASQHGELLIKSEHSEAISAVIKAIQLTDYIIDKDEAIAADGTNRVDRVVMYQTTFGEQA